MADLDPFDPYMQRVLVRVAMEDRGTRDLIRSLSTQSMWVFADPTARWVWERIEAGQGGTVAQLRNEALGLVRGDPAAAGVDQVIADHDARDQDYVRTKLVDFAKFQTFRRTFDEARELWNRGSQQAAYDHFDRRMDEIKRLKLDDADRGWHFEELDERMVVRGTHAGQLGRLSTGIDDFDAALNGGLGRGHMGLFFAYSGIGKTHALVDQAWGCVRERGRALYVVLEGGRAYVHDKFDARFMELQQFAVVNNQIDQARLEWVIRTYDSYKRSLVVRGRASEQRFTIDTLWGELEALHDQGWVPDLICVDYADELDSDEPDIRQRHIENVRGLHKLAMYRRSKAHAGHVLWSATQAVRPNEGADDREHVLWPSAIAEAWAKVWPVEAVVSINRTNAEKRDGFARLALGKNRHGPDGIVVKIETDYAGGALVRVGAPQVVHRRKVPPPPPGGAT